MKTSQSYFNTYRKKNLGLLIGSITFLIVAYSFSYQKAFRAYQEYNALNEQLTKAGTVREELVGLKNQLIRFQENAGSGYEHGRFFEQITGFCERNNILIKQFPDGEIWEQNGMEVLLHQLEVQGDFIAITKLIYAIEQDLKLGKVVSTSFDSRKNRQSKKVELFASMRIRNILHNETKNNDPN